MLDIQELPKMVKLFSSCWREGEGVSGTRQENTAMLVKVTILPSKNTSCMSPVLSRLAVNSGRKSRETSYHVKQKLLFLS